MRGGCTEEFCAVKGKEISMGDKFYVRAKKGADEYFLLDFSFCSGLNRDWQVKWRWGDFDDEDDISLKRAKMAVLFLDAITDKELGWSYDVVIFEDGKIKEFLGCDAELE